MLSYERQWHALDRGIGARGWEADFTPHAGGSLGTPFTFLNAGFTIRAGREFRTQESRQNFGSLSISWIR